MTRNIVIALINLAIAAIIGINAIMALAGGCDFGGGACSGGSGILTWVLAVTMPLIVIVGGFFALREWRKAVPEESRHIAIPMPTRLAARDEPDESDAEADDAMSARLARTVSAAHVGDVMPDSEAAGIEGEPETETSEQTPEEAGIVEWPSGSADAVADEAATFDAPSPPPAFVPPARQFTTFGDPSDGDDEDSTTGDERAIDWLVDSDDEGFAPMLREDSGFPWVVAGIDHVCVGVSRIGHQLIGTDFPAEAAAWRQVVGGLGRSELLARDDARAFTAWVNGILDVSGDAGLDLIEDALHELGVEAATDPILSARLPADMADFADHSASSSVLRITK